MSSAGKAKRVRIYVHEGDLIAKKPAHYAVMDFLMREHANGATIFRGAEGFGAKGQLRSDRFIEGMLARLPLVIEWIDTPERVDRLLEPLKALVERALITVDETAIALFVAHDVQALSTHVTAGEVMSRDVATVPPSASVRQVVELMFGKIYRAVPVVENGTVLGIVTNSDLLSRAGLAARVELLPSLDATELAGILDELDGQGQTARDVMTSPVVTVSGAEPLSHVADLMAQRHLKRVPVLDESGRLAGIVSRLDLLRTVAEGFSTADAAPREIGLDGELPVSTVMRREVPTVLPDSPVREVLQAVASTRLNRAVVVDATRHVLGVVTDAAVLERVMPSLRPGALHSLVQRLPFVHAQADDAARERHATAVVAKELMDPDVARVREETALRDVIVPMLEGAEKLVAVVDAENRLVGVVDRADVLRGLALSKRSPRA
ncbi:MAG TPA: DUF190 domain-containing protein [Polyangiaceae bacterium]|nr:DUF190 domain-containing protein [Polyangiaceae bacterium]